MAIEQRYTAFETAKNYTKVYTLEPTDEIVVKQQEDGMLGYISVEQLSSHLGSGNTSSGSNIDTLGGTMVRTLYTKDIDTSYISGSTNTDFFSGSLSWGSRALPQSFFDDSVNYVGKILHFRTVGKFASGGSDHTSGSFRLQIGDQILPGSDLGRQKLEFSKNHPFEIMGEVVISGGKVTTCYAIKYCDQTGDLKAIPLGDVMVSGSFSTLTPGDFKVVVSGSTDRTMNSYYSYFQLLN
jgi:hypothetical protein